MSTKQMMIAVATVAVVMAAPTATATANSGDGKFMVAQAGPGISADYDVPAGWERVSPLVSSPEAWIPAKAFRLVGQKTTSKGHYWTVDVLYLNNAWERYRYYDSGAKKGKRVGPSLTGRV